jgi:hypothetical protein
MVLHSIALRLKVLVDKRKFGDGGGRGIGRGQALTYFKVNSFVENNDPRASVQVTLYIMRSLIQSLKSLS